jgi:hypothetical protein
MQDADKKSAGGKGKSARIFAAVLLGLMAIIIVVTVVLFPRMEPFFLRKGFDYARLKLMATMPAIDGYNPEIHTHDPLEVSESFAAIAEALRIDTLLSEEFQDRTTAFMTLFKNCYDDQVLVPDEQTEIIEGLDSLQSYLLTTHFAGIVKPLLIRMATDYPESPKNMQEIIGFDSLAIYTPEIKLKMTGPLSLKLINSYYMASADKKIDPEEGKKISDIILTIERFQIRNEFEGVAKSLAETSEFEAFPEKEAFQENISIILAGLRNMDYDYSPVKLTLRSLIILWHEQRTSAGSEGLDLTPLFEFTRFVRAHAPQS